MQTAVRDRLRRQMKTLAYLTSAYARASDSFIRAEVLQLRRLGHTVHTFSVREAHASELVSEEIRDEHARTDYILKHGFARLLVCAILEFVRAPVRACSALIVAARCGWPGFKGRLWCYAYFLEACYLARRLRALHVEHLHVHLGDGCATVAMLASALSGVPFSMTVHGIELERAAVLSLEEKVRRSRFTVAVSEHGRSELLRWSARDDWPKIHVVRCGVRFDEPPRGEPARERRLVCVGRLSAEKGHLVLLEAIAALGAEAAFELVLVGDGPLRREIEAKAEALAIQDRVRLAGWMPAPKVREEILRCRALVLASFFEGIPVVIMEAFALERPVIATAVGGVAELVEPGISGWLVTPGSAEALARALREALSSDPHRLARMGRAGAARVRERHDQAREARRLAALMGEH
jgi:colanic acid/amylovoran biosynthesis glycosyltransferase